MFAIQVSVLTSSPLLQLQREVNSRSVFCLSSFTRNLTDEALEKNGERPVNRKGDLNGPGAL